MQKNEHFYLQINHNSLCIKYVIDLFPNPCIINLVINFEELWFCQGSMLHSAQCGYVQCEACDRTGAQ